MTPLEKIKASRGLPSKIARELGISPQAVFDWPRVPAERVLVVERLSGFSRHVLRPDIYPIEGEQSATKRASNGKAERDGDQRRRRRS